MTAQISGHKETQIPKFNKVLFIYFAIFFVMFFHLIQKHHNSVLKLSNILRRSYSVSLKEKSDGKHLEILNDQNLCDSLRETLDIKELYQDSQSFVSIPVPKLIRSMKSIEKKPQFNDIVSLIKPLYAPYLDSVNYMITSKKIGYDDLWVLFNKDDCVTYHYQDQLVSGKIDKCCYNKREFVINIKSLKPIGNNQYLNEIKKISIDPFFDLEDIDKLPVVHLDNDRKNEFTLRGEMVNNLNSGSHYLYHTGETKVFLKEKWYGAAPSVIKGRVIVDNYLARIVPNSLISTFFQDEIINKIETDQYFMIMPFVYGFTIQSKKIWCSMYIHSLKHVIFNQDAYDLLVLDQKIKNAIEILLTWRQRVPYVDFIRNKGGGSIILLSGPPGVGKTLTVEAIADKLKRPLYYCTVSDLGTDPETIDQNLSEILFICKKINALLLIDEADVFLEQRDNNNIVRNAMIAVFLRQLEYYRSDIFLTSNRVESFDFAVKSRITLHVPLKELSIEDRAKIWINLLSKTNQFFSDKDIQMMSNQPLNGREIKHIVNHALLLQHVDKHYNFGVQPFIHYLNEATNIVKNQ